MDQSAASSEWRLGIVGAFMSVKPAFDAIHELHVVGLSRTWLGFFQLSTNTGGTATLDAEWEGDPLDAEGVFTMRNGLQHPLSDSLRRRGVPAAAAFRFTRYGPPQGIVVVVDAKDRVDEATGILARHGGRLASA